MDPSPSRRPVVAAQPRFLRTYAQSTPVGTPTQNVPRGSVSVGTQHRRPRRARREADTGRHPRRTLRGHTGPSCSVGWLAPRRASGACLDGHPGSPPRDESRTNRSPCRLSPIAARPRVRPLVGRVGQRADPRPRDPRRERVAGRVAAGQRSQPEAIASIGRLCFGSEKLALVGGVRCHSRDPPFRSRARPRGVCPPPGPTLCLDR